MENTDDVVHRVVIDGQAGIARLGEEGSHLVHGGGILGGHDIHPGGEDLVHVHVVELDGRADKLALMTVQPAFVFRLAHHGDELLLGDAAVLLTTEDPLKQALQLGEEKVQGAEQEHEDSQNGGGEHGEGLRGFLGQTLGGDLAKDEDDDGENCCGQHGTVVAVKLGEEDGSHGGSGDVHDVVADEDGGQQAVIVLGQHQGQSGPAVSVFRLAFQADLVQGSKGCLGGGEIGG